MALNLVLFPQGRNIIKRYLSTSKLNKALDLIGESSAMTLANSSKNSQATAHLLLKPSRSDQSKALFPGFYRALNFSDSSGKPEFQAVKQAIQTQLARQQQHVAVFLPKNSHYSSQGLNQSDLLVKSADEVHNVGVLARIYNLLPFVQQSGDIGEGLTVLLYPEKIVSIKQFIKGTSSGGDDITVPKVYVDDYNMLQDESELDSNGRDMDVERTSLIGKLQKLASKNRLIRDQIEAFLLQQQQPSVDDIKLAHFIGSISGSSSLEQLQALLEARCLSDKLSIANECLNGELEKAGLYEQIISVSSAKFVTDSDADEGSDQRKQFLLKRLKSLEAELKNSSSGAASDSGSSTAKKSTSEQILSKFEKTISENRKWFPDNVYAQIQEELTKFQSFIATSSGSDGGAGQEFQLTRQYLDWLINLPWLKSFADENTQDLNMSHAKQILDADHYGLHDVKRSILEYLAVYKLQSDRGNNAGVKSKILCLVGPPGVGKTSIGKSIARCLFERPFYRFSVGGLGDQAEIKGHRRTYVGAMPGKLVQALRQCRVNDPVILIDEVDKLAYGGGSAMAGGEAASALLEVLDPEQNSEFVDHYLDADLPVDLSKVTFLCTANELDRIPIALRDRMEVLKIPGYVAEEKLEIAKRYLCRQVATECGLSTDSSVSSESTHDVAKPRVSLTDDAITSLIDNYCRENGVRNLKKHIEKIFRKASLDWLETPENERNDTLEVDSSQLKKYVGPPKFTSDLIYPNPPPGVVCGLAYNSMGGGSCLAVESVLEQPTNSKTQKNSSAPSFIRTGNLGDVMKESSSIAYSYAKHFLCEHESTKNNAFFDQSSVHLHLPEGATPKDGPSAGVALCTSLLSLAIGQPVSETIAMTGELSLTGKVLPVGGIKEKLLAAKRSGIETVLLPEDNRAEYDDLDDKLRQGVKVVFIGQFDQVAAIAFPDQFSAH